ncbi:MAG: benzoate/H(+) symporter BenE family transporter, partial [Bdellovibrionaceae bacterium]|nr:benzoate/H(+) symporter BenE family transporter [Pseudobdellovibrionaceae bacterium]
FSLNYAAITAAIAMGPDAHADRSRRYVAAVVSGVAYIMIGLFAGTVTSLFAAFPKEMITAIAGLALLGTVSSSLEKALNHPDDKEASFITFVIAASGLTFFGVSSAFWAIVVGLVVQYLTKKEGAQ